MTIQIPDDLARGLEELAAAQSRSVQEVAVERLRSLVKRYPSPQELLLRLQSAPYVSQEAVDEMEAAIAAGRLPVRESGVFDDPDE